MKKYESTKEGWLTLDQAQVLSKTTPVMLRRWRKEYPECFEVINGKCVHVNKEALNDKVMRIRRV